MQASHFTAIPTERLMNSFCFCVKAESPLFAFAAFEKASETFLLYFSNKLTFFVSAFFSSFLSAANALNEKVVAAITTANANDKILLVIMTSLIFNKLHII